MSRISCKITRRNRVAGATQVKDGSRVTISNPQTISTREMALNMERTSTLTTADVMAVMDLLLHEMEQALTAGQTVMLDGIGSFSLSIGLNQEVPVDEKVKARMIVPKGIVFRPAEQLLRHIEGEVSFVVDEDRRDLLPEEATVDAVRAWMEERRAAGRLPILGVRHMTTLLGGSRSTARKRLTRLVEEDYLQPSPDVAHSYMPGPRLWPSEQEEEGDAGHGDGCAE